MGGSTGESARVRGGFNVAEEDAALSEAWLDDALDILGVGAVLVPH